MDQDWSLCSEAMIKYFQYFSLASHGAILPRKDLNLYAYDLSSYPNIQKVD